MPDDPHAADRLPGSFRDPSGYVFRRGEQVFRAIDREAGQLLDELARGGLLDQLIRDRLLVGTQRIDDPVLCAELAAEHPGFEQFLGHETIRPITWPYEWSISMLADAGAATIDLQLRLLDAGCSLKDATAYNVQFVDGRPLWIDVTSIERPRRLDLWFAMGQFQRMFLFPLLLCRLRGWDLRSYFLASLDGRSTEQVAAAFGWFQRLRPALVWDVTLPAWLGRMADGRGRGQSPSSEPLPPPKSRQNSAALGMNLRRLRRKLLGLAAGYRPRGVWSEYARDCHYQQQAEAAKRELVERFLRDTQPAEVLDLGCNTGQYSRLAAQCGARVIAADGDHDAVELLYRQLRQRPAPISPMVVDLCNPSPGIGYMNRERASFFDRAAGDCVLALALVHHLLVAGNLSLEAIRDMLLALTRRDLVLEFVPRDDPMFRRLLEHRVDLFGDLSLDRCREVFCERFDLVQEEPIPGSKRTLLLLRRRD